MNKTRIITLLVLLLTSVSIQAQGVVRGEVRTPDGAPVEFVNIGVLGSTTSGTVTDARGRYRLQLREADSVTLRFSSVGYQPREFRVCVRGGQVLVLDCELTPASTTLEEVQVKDERIRTSTFTQIDVERLENTVGPQQGVESLIKTLPDVTSNNELSSQYSVRGGSFDENLVYINGVEIYRPQLVRSGQQEVLSRRLRRDLRRQALFGARHLLLPSRRTPFPPFGLPPRRQRLRPGQGGRQALVQPGLPPPQ